MSETMRPLIRLLQRTAILGLGILSVWLIVFVVFDFADQRLPWAVALCDRECNVISGRRSRRRRTRQPLHDGCQVALANMV